MKTMLFSRTFYNPSSETRFNLNSGILGCCKYSKGLAGTVIKLFLRRLNFLKFCPEGKRDIKRNARMYTQICILYIFVVFIKFEHIYI